MLFIVALIQVINGTVGEDKIAITYPENLGCRKTEHLNSCPKLRSEY